MNFEKLIRKILSLSEKDEEGAWTALLSFKNKLIKSDSATQGAFVDNALSLWNEYHQAGKKFFFEIVRLSVRFAQERHAKKLTEILAWPEVATDIDRSVRGHILSKLSEIGGPALIPDLMKAAELVQAIKYSDYTFNATDIRGHETDRQITYTAAMYNQWDQEEFVRAIVAIQARASGQANARGE